MSKDIENLCTEIEHRLCGLSGSICGAKAVLNHGGQVSRETILAIQADAAAIEQTVEKLRNMIRSE